MELCNEIVIRGLLERHGFRFSRSMGQNFLIDASVPAAIAEASEAGEENGVLEIGPGIGALSHELCRRAGRVVAVELDKALLPILDETMANFDNFEVVSADILKTDIPALVREKLAGLTPIVCANLPYNITTPAITALLESKCFESITVLVQKEVAERMSAKPSTKDYGAITVLCQYYTEPSIVANVPASLFVPPPKVDSAVLKLKVLDKPSVEVKDEGVFFRVVKAAFSQRRKTLLNCLSANFPIPKDEISTLLESIGIAPSRRGETLSLEEFANIADTLLQKIK